MQTLIPNDRLSQFPLKNVIKKIRNVIDTELLIQREKITLTLKIFLGNEKNNIKDWETSQPSFTDMITGN